MKVIKGKNLFFPNEILNFKSSSGSSCLATWPPLAFSGDSYSAMRVNTWRVSPRCAGGRRAQPFTPLSASALETALDTEAVCAAL